MTGELESPARHLRRLALSVCVLALIAGIGALPAGAAGGKKRHPFAVNVQSKNQAGVLRSSTIRLAVRSRHSGTARIVTTAKQRGKWAAIARPRTVRLRRGAKRLIALRLTGAGSSRLTSCGTTFLRVRIAGRWRIRGTRRVRRTRGGDGQVLRANSQRCNLPAGVDLTNANRCDFIAPSKGSECLMPFPDDYYTKSDPSTDTGLRVDLKLDSTPENVGGTHVNPTDMNRSDGFSPGAPIVLRVPGMDTPAAFAQTGAVPITKMSESFAPNQPIVVIDTANNERQLIWSELDANATTPGATDLLIHPGKNLLEGHRYIVALRGMKNASGAVLSAPPGFRLYRDSIPTDKPVVENRRTHFNNIFRHLQNAGIGRGGLYMAWDFTVASERNISEAMLKIRNDALAQLGDTTPGDGVLDGVAPSYTITDVKTVGAPTPNDLTGSHAVENVREVTGTYQVPCYLDNAGCVPGGKFTLGSDGLPVRTPGNFQTARFTCNIPQSAVSGAYPYTAAMQDRTSMYGHGLFGDYTEVHTTNVRQLGNDHDVITCATDFTGMMEDDVPSAGLALLDLSKFSVIPDGLQQGFVNFIYLGRMLKDTAAQGGLAGDAAFKFGGTSVIDPGDLYYYGNSQGGIAGGALTAVEPDLTRTVLYVPGMNYSLLLTRSTDFDDYSAVLYPSYPNERVRPLLLSMIQMEWDRGEPDGYAQHMTTDPLPGTPPHKVLIEMAYGDHQVANVATQVEARTIGAPLRQPALDLNRLPSGFDEPFYAQNTLGALPGPAEDGSGMFIWDIGPKRDDGSGGTLGTDPPPINNTSPNNTFGVDPHDTVIRQTPAVRTQIADFLKVNGKITDPCGPKPCYAAGWTGP